MTITHFVRRVKKESSSTVDKPMKINTFQNTERESLNWVPGWWLMTPAGVGYKTERLPGVGATRSDVLESLVSTPISQDDRQS